MSVLLLRCTFQASVGDSPLGEVLLMKDTVYAASVRSLRCYTERGGAVLAPPIRAVEEDIPLRLSFDIVGTGYQACELYLIRCDSDWQPTKSITTAFVSGINQYFINNFQYSTASTPPYVSYNVVLPKVRLAGNYLAVVHRAGNRKDLLLTARFMVYKRAIHVDADITTTRTLRTSAGYHRLNIRLNYSGVPRANPYRDLHVYIRQNRNWLSLRKLTQPTRSPGRYQVVYRAVFGENDFCALPSFRRFDTRNWYFKGTGISKWAQDSSGHTHVYLNKAHSRVQTIHDPLPDINGNYVIGNNSFTQRDGRYTTVHLQLALEAPMAQPIYVLGSFNHWARSPYARMRYDSTTNRYSTALNLKQGYYEYLFWTQNGGFEAIEGCWAHSENEYEVMIYYTDRDNWDEPMVGYLRFQNNLQ